MKAFEHVFIALNVNKLEKAYFDQRLECAHRNTGQNIQLHSTKSMPCMAQLACHAKPNPSSLQISKVGTAAHA